MRRSKAPSELAKYKSSIESSGTKQNFITSVFREVPVTNILKETGPELNDIEGRKQSGIRLFNVVYGKISKKKHKTWEGDGTLEVSSSSLTLKDSTGKTLGQVRSSKNLNIEEGGRIFVGNKEVEIVDAVEHPAVQLKRSLNDYDGSSDEVQLKKQKSTSFSNPLLSNLSLSSLRTNKLHSPYEPLIMPTPTDEHQWECNTDYLPLSVVSIEANLCRILRPHQREGITFLYRCISGIRNLQYMGAILADEMGLGKTLQCISLIWTLLKQGPYGGIPLLKRIVVIVPCSVVQNWNNEFIRWIGSHRLKTFPIDKKNRPEDYAKNSEIPVVIISYEMFVRGFNFIKDIQFDLIVCDEGHRLKNSNIKAATLLYSLPCKRRILLTGTPVQNDLQEFFSIVDLVNPGVLGSARDFQKKFANAILAAKEPNASEDIVKEGKEKSEELNRLTSSFILRRTQSVIDRFLPVKNEYVVFCSASSVQKQIYNAVTELWHSKYIEDSNLTELPANTHLHVIHALKKICNHPILLNKQLENNSNEEFSTAIKEIIMEQNYSIPSVEDSGKLKLVRGLLKSLSNTKERIVLISCFTQTLDLLEDLCKESNYKYQRFDGSTPLTTRSSIVNKFNDNNSDLFVLLLSSKAGGIGLNLIGGSRLVLYDSDWNPATDLQAMARIWREGQRKTVYIYRLLTSGSIEEKIYQRQLSKAGLNESIVDVTSESNVKLSIDELKNLFSPIGSNECITHTSLNCACDGDGSIPETCVDEETCREAELLKENKSVMKPSLRMNQLFLWEHHKKPVSEDVLTEMCLHEVGDGINFVFKNKSS